MTIGLLKEPSFENRVALMPAHVAELVKKGHQVFVETGAGAGAFASDNEYTQAGATVTNRTTVCGAQLLVTLNAPTIETQGKTLVGNFQPLNNTQLLTAWTTGKHTVFSLDLLPRTTRAQGMDVLSSQANIAGYKAVLLAASLYSRYVPMLMTAAGSIAPAKFLVMGAGVAGLQAVATARRLGGVVEVFDTRPAVKEEVQSLGARFIEVAGAADASSAGGYAVEQSEAYQQAQRQRIAESVQKADIVITTAQIPGKKAPLLLTEDMLRSMRKGAVVVDLAAATGGNTAVTKNGETVLFEGVQVVGNSALAAAMPSDASKLYGKNVLNFFQLLTGTDGTLAPQWNDELVSGCCAVKEGVVVHPRLKEHNLTV